MGEYETAAKTQVSNNGRYDQKRHVEFNSIYGFIEKSGFPEERFSEAVLLGQVKERRLNGSFYVDKSDVEKVYKKELNGSKIRIKNGNLEARVEDEDLKAAETLLGTGNSLEKNYSIALLKLYDIERHISIKDAYTLLQENAPHLNSAQLSHAIESRQIHVYEFKGNQYLDRLDIGRVFHQRKEKKGLTIDRHFTDGKTDPYEAAGPLVKRHLQISDWDTGKTIFEMGDAYFPESWDDNDANIVAQKYFFKPSKIEWKEKLQQAIGNDHEHTLAHLVRRVTNFITDTGDQLGYFATQEDREVFREELAYLQMNRMFAFNSPVQFNAGIFNEYGIRGSEGLNFRRDPETGEISKLDAEYVHPQCHACFIKGPRDDLESILEHMADEGRVFSAGSGIGQDIGVLRANGEPLHGGGKASGPMSFFKIFDASAGTIKSGGKSRRAARMTTMRYNHPDIMEFIIATPNEDKKELVLMKNGYSPGMDGEAYKTVAFQNTNLSVRLDDEFFRILDEGGEVELRRITDGKVVEKVSAERMLKEIAFGSWRIGDPAVQYETKIQEMHTAKNSGRQNSTNPCTEYDFLNDTSCNLGSHNLLQYADEKGNFNVEAYMNGNYITTIALDIINDGASYPIEDIARISPEFRTIGLGYANLGALLMRRGLAYDSEEGRALAGAITAVMTGNSYEMSTNMAEKLEPFIHFEFNKAPMLDVMRKHQASLEDVVWEHVPKDIKEEAYRTWQSVVDKGERFGFRNAQATVLAPTGTISFLMGCDTTGVEPAISLSINKNLAGGGNVILTNREAENALKNLGYSENQVEEISKHVKDKNTVRGAPHINPQHYPVFDTALGNKDGEGAIPFEGHVRMLGAAQPFISGAISKTNNLPTEATVKDTYDGYLLGHKLGLKALAVFRKDSKPIAALDFGGRSYIELKRGEKEELPTRRNSFESEVTIEGTPLHVIVSEYEDGRPGQIVFLSYTAGSTLKALLETLGITTSTSLKRRVKLEDAVKGWRGQQFDPQGLVIGHPYIKMALSPLDYAAKLLLLEYKGDIEVAENKDGLDISQLRGSKNGVFRTYERSKINVWDADQVLDDPELGGFTKTKTNGKSYSDEKPKQQKRQNNARGVTCMECGNIMMQTAPNCYECNTCGDKIGGCGQ